MLDVDPRAKWWFKAEDFFVIYSIRILFFVFERKKISLFWLLTSVLFHSLNTRWHTAAISRVNSVRMVILYSFFGVKNLQPILSQNLVNCSCLAYAMHDRGFYYYSVLSGRNNKRCYKSGTRLWIKLKQHCRRGLLPDRRTPKSPVVFLFFQSRLERSVLIPLFSAFI